MNKTKKYKKKGFQGKKKRFYTKKRGGSSESKEEEKKNNESNTKELNNNESKESNTNTNTNNNENQNVIDEIRQEVQEEKKHHNNNDNLLEKSGEIAEGVALNAVDKVGDILGVDLEDPNLTEKNKEKLEHITKNAAEVGSILVESVEPFAKPMIEKTIQESGEILSDAAETGVKVLLNTAEEIPGAGVVIGSLRSIGNIGDAVVSSVNAGSEIISSSADTINASVKNFDRLIKEKEDIANRTKASIDEFTGGFKSRKKRFQHKNKKSKSKTKKRRL